MRGLACRYLPQAELQLFICSWACQHIQCGLQIVVALCQHITMPSVDLAANLAESSLASRCMFTYSRLLARRTMV